MMMMINSNKQVKPTMVQLPQDEETAIEMERNRGSNGLSDNTVGIIEGQSEDDEDEDHSDNIDHNSNDGLMRDVGRRHGGRHHHDDAGDNDVVKVNRGTLCQLVLIVFSFTFLVGVIGYTKGKQAGAQSYAAYMTARSNKNTTSTGGSNDIHNDDDDYFEPTPPPRTKAPSASPSRPSSGSSSSSSSSSEFDGGYHHFGPMMDGKTFTELSKEVGLSKKKRMHTVSYDADWISTVGNPFEPLLTSSSSLSSSSSTILTPPLLFADDGDSSVGDPTMHAYLKSPHVVDNKLVFLAEGDVYLTQLQTGNFDKRLPAMKLTTTIGNVLDPKWHPTLPLLAFTATYSGRRDVYLMDYSSTSPTRTPLRLTYWDVGAGGVSGVVGWDVDDSSSSSSATSIIFRAMSNDVSLPDSRLYKIHLETTSNSNGNRHAVLEIEPVPLAQAMDATRFDECWYFVRYKQSSQTIRYVGGTAENLWRYCDDDPTSSKLFGTDHNYRGTSKSPQIYHADNNKKHYVFFLSDRGRNQQSWVPDRMNVWAVEVGGINGSNTSKDGIDSLKMLIQITDTSCDFEGRTIQEFSVDVATGNMVLRIGADLYIMSKDTIEGKLKSSTAPKNNNSGGSGVDDQKGGDDKKAKDDGNRRVVLRHLQETNVTTSNITDTVAPTAAQVQQTEVSVQEKEEPDVLPEKAEENDVKEVLDGGAVNQTEAPATAAPEDLDGLHDLPGNTTLLNGTEPPVKYYYDYESPELVSRADVENGIDHFSGRSAELKRLPVVVHSDFSTQQERLIPVSMTSHLKFLDVFETITQDAKALMTLRGQVWVAPVVDDGLPPYEEAGQNLPARVYRVAPGSMMGGATRILAAFHVPNSAEDETSDRRLAVILATDPLTDTAEHAFYLIEVQPSSIPLFVDLESLPKPFLGGAVSGGSTKDGGLGSVKPDTIAVSPCGNRMAWSDTDGRIVVMNLPQYQDLRGDSSALPKYEVLPKQNELGEPMVGDEVELTFSPGGRYLAVQHNARNQFQIISIVDLGDPLAEPGKIADISIGRIVQATPARFNSMSVYWGQSPTDIHDIARDTKYAGLFGTEEPDDVATTLYFLSDRDILTDVSSPWGYRQRMPHFVPKTAVYALPFTAVDESSVRGQYRGGGAVEVQVDVVLERMSLLKLLLSSSPVSGRRERRDLAETVHPLAGAFGYADRAFRRRHLSESEHRHLQEESDEEDYLREAYFPSDMDIDFGPVDLSFARQAYRIAMIPEANYVEIICQTPDNGSLVLVKSDEDGAIIEVFMTDSFPSDQYSENSFSALTRRVSSWQLSTSRNYFSVVFSPDGAIRVVENSALGIAGLLSDTLLDNSVVDKTGIVLSVWPALEYRQMYDDAWRMLRDYYYDPEMTGIDWIAIHQRYLPLVERCTKREELDDALAQMASELSALHVFVYGGEYDSPIHGSLSLSYANEVGGLGAVLKRTPEWNGYTVMSIADPDPDFTMIDQSTSFYSPLSDQSLRLSGQVGLQVGDVIVGVNGESVMKVPDIHMLLRGKSGATVRLDVLRLASGPTKNQTGVSEIEAEPLIVSPVDPEVASDLLYRSWEWKTEQLAQDLAEKANITVGYVHLQDMSGPEAEDAFARGFFPNYQKQGFILDVRHNRGGNIDSWVLDVLQRKPWMYWQSRDFDVSNGGIGWDEHFAFRGHIVVLLDEKTSSDGEGVSRGISELGLGKLIGTRTWGGGIWLASDNRLVDGGIASAPEIGTYNGNFGWGLGIENVGVEPDIVVDNDPHETFLGKDRQLERAIEELKKWIEAEPVLLPKAPSKKKDMTMGERECNA